MPNAKIKWGAKELKVDVNLEEAPLLFKAQLFELTNIPPERQKLIVRGKTISDESWNGVKIQEGTVVMLVGTADLSVIKASKNDSESQEKPAKQTQLPIGLRNLGNTCYMNSSLQCFKTIPELTAALEKYNPSQGAAGVNWLSQPAKLLTNSLKELYNQMNETSKSHTGDDDLPDVTPFLFLDNLRQTFPQFNTLDERGNNQQQDANECFCEVLRMVCDETLCSPEKSASSENHKSLKKFFEIEQEVTVKCLEEGNEEEPQKSKETIMQLSCFVDQEVRYILTGIKNKLVEEIEKNSTTLGRNSKFQKRSLISRLPAYLSIQVVRFCYKEDKKISAKVLKDVKFPIMLDVFDLCTSELQEKLKPARTAFKEYDETKLELTRKAKLAGDGNAKIDLQPKEYFPNTFPDDIGSNNSGLYELKCLITHKGRSSNSGHYVSWVRVGDDEDSSDEPKWVVCDDDNVEPVTEDEILKLSGGGDWHCAYVFVYGPKKIPVLKVSKDE